MYHFFSLFQYFILLKKQKPLNNRLFTLIKRKNHEQDKRKDNKKDNKAL